MKYSNHHGLSAETLNESGTQNTTSIPWHIVRQRLKSYQRQEIIQDEKQRAAVAILVFSGHDGIAEILFMKRAEHPHDPWSGHMAFPGGHVDPDDASSFDAVIREVEEEIKLILPRQASLLTTLNDVRAMAHGKQLPLIITPFVFELTVKPVLTPNEEVVETHWVPLSFFFDHASRGVFPYVVNGIQVTLPCYQYAGRTIWGLTYRMLQNLLHVITQHDN